MNVRYSLNNKYLVSNYAIKFIYHIFPCFFIGYLELYIINMNFEYDHVNYPYVGGGQVVPVMWPCIHCSWLVTLNNDQVTPPCLYCRI